jgi:hypothetical protein
VPEGVHELGMLVRAAVASPDIMYYVMKDIKNDFWIHECICSPECLVSIISIQQGLYTVL